VTAQRVYGVDFSGATDAGKGIWIAETAVRDGFLSVRRCYPARDLPESAVGRQVALKALRELIASRPGAVFGIDVPFGLPATLVDESSWPDFATRFVGRYADAEAFKAACSERAGRRELKRQTDQEARTPFSAYNLRLYRQTFHGLNDVIGPLVADHSAAALPMQQRGSGGALLVEVCPASTLIFNGVNEPYKRRERGDARARIVEWLVRTTPMAISADVRALAVADANGDAVDALIAAGAAARALTTPATATATHMLEGYVYL
jgi:Protein of unknown function (DUF429)